MQNNKRNEEEFHEKLNLLQNGKLFDTKDTRSKVRFPYEFLASVDKGWIPCDILEVDTAKELVKIVFYNPDAAGWMDICGAAGVYDDVVQMWRVRLRED